MGEKVQKIRPAIAAMRVGQVIAFPVERMKCVRVMASDLGLILNRRYTTNVDREARMIEVKRLT